MLKTRVIPALLLRNGGLVKTRGFCDPVYVGDPINAVKIFNDKEVDELVFLDIEASKAGREPNFELLESIAAEAFMPFGYGGGVRTLDQLKRLLSIGIEKVILNTAALENPGFVEDCARVAGSSSVVVSIDVAKGFFGRRDIRVAGGSRRVPGKPDEVAAEMERRGAGEILLNSIDRDGTGKGYDLELVGQVSRAVGVPVVACGGAGSIAHMRDAVDAGAAAVAAGSMFVFHGPHRAVLISYPQYDVMERLLR
jgi:cyclase